MAAGAVRGGEGSQRRSVGAGTSALRLAGGPPALYRPYPDPAGAKHRRL